MLVPTPRPGPFLLRRRRSPQIANGTRLALVVDTGPLLAALDRNDRWHSHCAELLESSPERLVLPAAVLPELDYLLRARLGTAPFVDVLEAIERGEVQVEDVATRDFPRIRELQVRYGDTPVGFVDAAVLAITERLGEPKLATLDRRHFALMRPRHVEALELLPQLD